MDICICQQSSPQRCCSGGRLPFGTTTGARFDFVWIWSLSLVSFGPGIRDNPRSNHHCSTLPQRNSFVWGGILFEKVKLPKRSHEMASTKGSQSNKRLGKGQLDLSSPGRSDCSNEGKREWWFGDSDRELRNSRTPVEDLWRIRPSHPWTQPSVRPDCKRILCFLC